MKNIKIIQLLETFNEEEFSGFVDFAKSVYYRKERKYNEILNEIKNYLSEARNLKDISPGKFYERIIRNTKLNYQTLRNRLNELTKISERFIIEKELDKQKNIRELLLLNAFKNRKLNKQFLIEYKKISEIIINKTEKSNIDSDILNAKVMFSKENRNFQEMFSDYNKYLEYFFVYFLEIYFEAAKEYEIEKSYNVNPTIKILEILSSNLNSRKLIKSLEEQNNPSYFPVIFSYYKFKSLENLKDMTWFNKLQKLFYSRINELDNELKNNLMTHMISYYFYKINSGQSGYLKDVFKLYNLKLRLGLYSEIKEIRYPSSAFRDYVVVGIRLKRYRWVENFIKKYSVELPEEIRDEETYMAYARLYLEKKEYSSSLEMANKISSDNPLYYLDATRNKLRIFYETVDFEKAFLEMDRIRHYIKNNMKRIALPIRKYAKEFIDFYNKLLKFRLNPDRTELEFLLQNIMESNSLPQQNWLIEKVKEMKNN